MREITVFDLVKHLELDNFCDLIFGAVNDIGTQEGLKAALQTEITKEELQRINAAALREADEFRTMCRPIISYLEKYCDPYTEVHISMDEIKVTSIECGIPVKAKDG